MKGFGEGSIVQRKVSLLYLLLILLLAWPLPARGWSGRVIGVAAGDTITVLRGEQPVQVLLYGIDCPDEGQPFGTEAKQFTSTMVFGRVTVRSPSAAPRDAARTIARASVPCFGK